MCFCFMIVSYRTVHIYATYLFSALLVQVGSTSAGAARLQVSPPYQLLFCVLISEDGLVQ